MACKNSKLIVCVDDEPDMVHLLNLILEKEGIRVRAASSGHEGLTLMRQLEPDLVILDLMLPDMYGGQVLKEMQRDLALKNIPVVVVTVLTRSSAGQEWLPVEKLAGFVTKPFAVREIRRTVKRVLETL